MNRADLIQCIARKQDRLPLADVEWAVKQILEYLSRTLADGERVEIRGFGSFALRYRGPRIGRNPRTGEVVSLTGKYVPHFKPGKRLRERVDQGRVDSDE